MVGFTRQSTSVGKPLEAGAILLNRKSETDCRRESMDLFSNLISFLNKLQCWFSVEERKTGRTRKRTNDKLNPNVVPIHRESNRPGHIGGRRVLSPLRHPYCSVCVCKLDSCLSYQFSFQLVASSTNFTKTVDFYTIEA